LPWIRSFKIFHRDVAGGWHPGLVLRRIDDQDIFRPGNVEWTKSRSSRNTSGVRGVSWNHRQNKWHAYLNVDHRRINLGWFDGFDDAARARADAELKYWGEPTAKVAPKSKQRRGHVRLRGHGKWEATFRKRLLGKFATQEAAEAAIAAVLGPDPKRIIRTIKQIAGRRFKAPSPPPRRTLGDLWRAAA